MKARDGRYIEKRATKPKPFSKADLYKAVDNGWRHFWAKRGGVPVVSNSFQQ